MARTDADAASLVRAWTRGEFRRAYLLGGPDALTKEEIFQILKERFLGADAAMNVDLFDGNDASAGTILTAAATLPFFGGRRLVAVRRAQGLTTTETNRLADGLAALPETNLLVLMWDDKVNARSVLVQAVKAVGEVAVFWPPFENQMPAWIMDRAARLNKRMDRSAAAALLDAVGPSLPDLHQEVQKLALYVRDRPEVTVQDVAAASGERVALKFMEWERALWSRDRGRSLRILETLRGQGDPPESLLPQVIRAVQKLLMGKALFAERGADPREVFDRLRLRLMDAQRDFREGLLRWTWDDLTRALDRLVETDLGMKTGRTSPDAELTRAVWALTAGEEVGALRRP